MRVNINQPIKSCGTRTVPATKTKSIGLQADTRVVMVFASPSGQYHRDTNLSSTYRDLAKTHANPDPSLRSGQAPTATNQTAGPLGFIVARLNHI
jgi:hypothetical protein